MFPLPSLPTTAVPDTPVPSTRPFDRECHLLRLLADTFAYELNREMQLRLEGAVPLPVEWVDYLERERQKILDKIHQINRLQDLQESIAPSHNPQVDDSAPSVIRSILQALPSTSAPHTGDEVRDGPTPYSPQSISEAAIRPPCRHKGLLSRSAIPEIDSTLSPMQTNPVVFLTNNCS